MNSVETTNKDLYDLLVKQYGSNIVNIGTVRRDHPQHITTIIKTCTRTTTRGMWDITNLSGETQMTQHDTNSDLIPSQLSSYVPFGCFDVVRNVIKSNVWAPVYITGDSGNGKTLGVEQACAVERRKLIAINITNETSEEDLIGNFSLKDGDMVWNDGPVIRAMKEGAVILLDEIDQATSRILCLQTILQNYAYNIKKTGEIVKAQPGFAIVATSNTKGNGEGADRFIGANILNEAFLERFSVIVEQDYPTATIETKILKKVCKELPFIEQLVKFANAARSTFKEGGISSPITTRRLVQICNNYMIFNDKTKAVTFALNRFNEDDKNSLIRLFKSFEPPKAGEKPAEPKEETKSVDDVWHPF